MSLRTRLAVAAVAALAIACVPEHSPLMRPGQDCLFCHQGETKPWTVAGTVYGAFEADENDGLEGAEVLVRDSDGKELTLRTNPAGNFFTAEALAFPLRVEIRKDGHSVVMNGSPASGSCNTCHTAGSATAPGRVALPPPRLAQ